MPNWCQNILVVTGPEEAIQNFRRFLWVNEDPATRNREEGLGRLSFQAFIPMPDPPPSSIRWATENWGTKWDIDPHEGEPTDETEDLLVYSFDTAWSPPLPAVAAMHEQFPALRFELKYLELGTAFGGKYTAESGEYIDAPVSEDLLPSFAFLEFGYDDGIFEDDEDEDEYEDDDEEGEIYG